MANIITKEQINNRNPGILTPQQLREQEAAKRRAENEKSNNNYMTGANAPEGSQQAENNRKAPTIGSVIGTGQAPDPAGLPSYLDSISGFYQDVIDGRKTQKQMYDEILASKQEQINANNKVYADIISKAKEQARQLEGSARAQAARSGTLGSPIGDTAIQGAQGAGNEAVVTIEHKLAADNANVVAGAATEARANYSDQQTNVNSAITGLFNYGKAKLDLSEAEAKKQKEKEATIITNLASGGVDTSKYTDQDWNKLAQEYGVDATVLKAGVTTKNKQTASDNLKQLLSVVKDFNIPLTNGKIAAQLTAYEKELGYPEGFFKAASEAVPDIDWTKAIHTNGTDASGKDFISVYDPKTGTSKKFYTGGVAAAVVNNNIGDPATAVSTAIDANSNSILAQTGLPSTVFNYLTQGTSSMTRFSEATRKKITADADVFLNKNGLDYSTFVSRYKAYNETLQKNIQRFNNTVIAEGELKGTVENLSTAATAAGFDDVRALNAAKKWAKGELNNPDVQTYAVHLNQLRSELAYYNAAVQGKTSADLIEFQEAEKTIKDGISSGSLIGFKNAITASVEKMDKTLQGSVDRSNKQIWDLFGVGGNYKTTEQKKAAPAKLPDGVKDLSSFEQ